MKRLFTGLLAALLLLLPVRGAMAFEDPLPPYDDPMMWEPDLSLIHI